MNWRWLGYVLPSIFLVTGIPVVGQTARPPAKPVPPRPTIPGPAFTQVMREADAARESSRLDDAIRLYRQAVSLNARAPEAWWYMAMCHYERDEYAEAEPAFARVVALDQKNGAALAMLGLCQFRNRRFDESLKSLVLAKSLGVPAGTQMETVARYHLILLLNRAGQHELAGSLLMDFAAEKQETPQLVEAAGINALRLSYLPGEAPAAQVERIQLAGRSAMSAWLKRVPEAKQSAATLIERYPQQPNAHYLMGYLLLLENDESAIGEFQKEIEISPGHIQARLQIGHEYLKRGQAERGLPFTSEAVRLAPRDFTAQNIHGRVLLDMGRLPEAIAALESAARLAPTSPEAHYHLSVAYARSGRKTDAERHRAIFTSLKK